MRITAGGNVGIGTTTPSQKLEVVGGEIKAGRVDSTNEGGQVSFGRASDNATGWYIDVYGSSSTPDLRVVDVSNSAVRMVISGNGTIFQGPIATYGQLIGLTSPYTADLRLNITHSGWGGNYDSGTLYVEYQGRAYGSNQLTTAYGMITYQMNSNGVSITNVVTTGVTTSNVTLSTDVSTNLVLRVTFNVTQTVDRMSIFARTTNGFVTSISTDTV